MNQKLASVLALGIIASAPFLSRGGTTTCTSLPCTQPESKGVSQAVACLGIMPGPARYLCSFLEYIRLRRENATHYWRWPTKEGEAAYLLSAAPFPIGYLWSYYGCYRSQEGRDFQLNVNSSSDLQLTTLLEGLYWPLIQIDLMLFDEVIFTGPNPPRPPPEVFSGPVIKLEDPATEPASKIQEQRAH